MKAGSILVLEITPPPTKGAKHSTVDPYSIPQSAIVFSILRNLPWWVILSMEIPSLLLIISIKVETWSYWEMLKTWFCPDKVFTKICMIYKF